MAFVKKGTEAWNAEKNAAAVDGIKSEYGQASLCLSCIDALHTIC